MTAVRTYCRHCERSVVHVDEFGYCRKCAAEIGDDGSYTLEGAIDDIVWPKVRERLHKELRALRRAARA